MHTITPRQVHWLFLFCILTSVVVAQGKYPIADYLPNQLGDSLRFQTVAPEAGGHVMVAWPDTQVFRKQTVLKCTESTGAWRLETVTPDKGWQWYVLSLQRGQEMVFDMPLLVLPAEVEHGATYRQAATFAVYAGGRKQGGGALTIEVKVEGKDSSRTPLRNFDDCLVIVTTLTRTDPDGIRRGAETKAWYARHFGLVKMATESFALDARGNRLRTQKSAIMLEKAKIGGERYRWNP